MKQIRHVICLLLVTAVLPLAYNAYAIQSVLPSAMAAALKGMQHMEGYFPLDWDPKTGKLYLEITRFDSDFLYLDSLPHGLGSNDLGLDRGQLGQGRLVRFHRSGPKVLLVQPNLAFRSSSTNPAERLAVEQSFAESVLWGFKIESEDNNSVLVDATDFYLHDAHGVAERLAETNQGNYRVDPARSAIALENTKNFPRNTEAEAILTFTTDGPVSGRYVREVTPDAHAITLREHHSFIQLPESGYRSRAFDPRSGYFDLSCRDYSAPLGESLDVRFIARHRLQKKSPNEPVSEPIVPIVYYVDRGAPDLIRNALIEGANWWGAAFEAAGYRNAFRVEVLPEGADPMDVRYNTIQWVHRYTRGWSYGESIVDPRTGEIIKGQVTLGSLRGRQDYLIAESLLAPYAEGKAVSPEMQEMVLARLRQLAAHEVGHTLGLAHNFAASSLGQNTSVMDYPHPLIKIDMNGRPDLSHAYGIGIGAWDKVAIAYGYSEFQTRSDASLSSLVLERTALDTILTKAHQDGLYFMTDEDARPAGSAHPHAHLWDNGTDSAEELERILAVRSTALKRFSEDAIRPGVPMAMLEDTLVPLYLLHRYQTEAAAKEIGGLDYRYALRGDGQLVTKIVPGADQRKALSAVLKTISADTLTLPEAILQKFPPRASGFPRTRESFEAKTGLTFDPITTAESAADLSLKLLFDPQRASRLVEYHARDASCPGLDEVIQAIMAETWNAPRTVGLNAAIQRAVETDTLEYLLGLAADTTALSEVRAIARFQVDLLKSKLAHPAPGKTIQEQSAHAAAALARIAAFEKEPGQFRPATAADAPPGMPIGDEDDFQISTGLVPR